MKLITKHELMDRLGIIAEQCLTFYRKDGMPAHKVGYMYMYDMDEVQAWMATRKKGVGVQRWRTRELEKEARDAEKT